MTPLEKCDLEIARCESELMAGHPDIEGLLLGLRDWKAERRLIVQDEGTLDCKQCGEIGELNKGEDSGYPQFWISCWRQGIVCCSTQRMPTRDEAAQKWADMHRDNAITGS